MTIARRAVLQGVAAAAVWGAAERARAQADGPVKIGLLSDLSSAYADVSGPGLVKSAQMAAADFGLCLGRPVEVLAADCQLKPDISSTIARRWWDTEGVDAIGDLPSSAVALAIAQLGTEKKKVVLATCPGTADITGKACSPYVAHWVHDSVAVARTLVQPIVEKGGDSWFFIAADYVFGASLVNDASAVLKTSGAKVAGVVRAPLGTADFSSYLLQAQASGAKVIALANAGADTTNCIKQAAEFGLTKQGKMLACLVIMDTDIHSIGLPMAQGILLSTAFYWDRTDASRAWSRRYFKEVGRMPTMLQAGAYSQVAHYLKAVQTAGRKDADAVMAAMKAAPIDDFFAKGVLRPDGRMVHDMYLARVKTPAESKEPWDQYEIAATVPGDRAFRSMADGACPLVK